ncbi:MAG: GAF domain-containing protein, partial [Chloroflexi bacterium]|nr:GAF domain-containing protein [Chloroflexota bacterium]
LYDQLQQAHRASELLANIGKELASSLHLDELIERLVRVPVPQFADWCVIDVVEEGYAQRVAVAHVDPAKEELARQLQRRFRPVSEQTSPIRRVLDSGEPLFVPEYTLDFAPRQGVQDPEMDLLRQLQPKSTISVPLSGRRGAIGVMSFLQSDSGRRFAPQDLDLAREVAGRAGMAIENAQLYRDTQRHAISRREAEERQRFIADASKVLDSSLDYRVTLDNLARLAVPRMADWCVVDILQDGKLRESAAIAATDPQKEALAREYQRRWPASMDEDSGVPRVIRTGQPSLAGRIPPEAIEASAKDEEHLAVIRALGPWTSALIVPITARGQTLGAISLITAESGRVYIQDDVELALEVAARAGLAMDNARLYAAERRARIEGERLQALADQLGQSLAVEQVLEVIAATAAELLRAPVAGVFVLNEAERTFDLVAGVGFDVANRDARLPWDRSVAGHVASSGQAVLIEDVRQAGVSALPRLVAGEDIGSLVVAPVTSRSGVLGVIEVYNGEIGAFEEHDAGLLLALAANAATALENARAYTGEQRARRQAERLQALTSRLGQKVAAEDVLDQIAATAAELLAAPVAGVFLLDDTGEYFDLVAGQGLDIGQDIRLPRGQSLAGQVIASGEAQIVEDARQAPVIALPRLVSGESVGSLIVAPVTSPSTTLGVIEVYSIDSAAFDERDADLLTALASAAGVVVENARLYRQRELDLSRLHAIVAQLPVGIIVVEAPSGEVSLRNAQAEQVYGAALDSLRVGSADSRIGFHSDGRRYELADWPLTRALRHGEAVFGERIDLQRPDGRRSVFSINAAPIRDSEGAIVAAVAVFDDVSGEEELRRQREQFLAAAAHDLKTPLTTIQGLVQLLGRQLGRLELPQPERFTATMQSIETGTRKMNGLIDELLDLTRLETTGTLSLNRRAVDLARLCQTVLDSYAHTADNHRLVLDGPDEPLVGHWDEPRLERVISNLVGNAIKYSPDGGEIRLAVRREAQGWARVTVTDQGIGIPPADVERIFDRFQRGSNVPGTLSGSGVGLSYVRQLVVEHGGAISVQSQLGAGTTFTFTLPLEVP